MQTEQDPTRLLRSLLDISLQLAGDLDLEHVLSAIVERSMELTGAHFGLALTVTDEMRIDTFVNRGPGTPGEDGLARPPENTGLLATLLSDRKPVRVVNTGEHSNPTPFKAQGIEIEAFLGMPLHNRGSLVGALCLGKPPGAEPFGLGDESLLQTMGAIASIGVANARLFAAETERAERSALLQEISSKVRRSLDASKVLATTVETLGRAGKVDRCFIRLVEPAESQEEAGPLEAELGQIEFEWDAPGVLPLKDAVDQQFPVSSLAAATLATQSSSDVTADQRLLDPSLPGSPTDLLRHGIRAAISTPLVWGDEFMGVVTFHSTSPRDWSGGDVALLEAAAREVSIAIHHARMYGDAVDTAERLQELDRMRSEFVSMVSHELRSPMTVVGGISEILQNESYDLTLEQRTELMDTLGREARRLSRLVSEVLDLEAMDRDRLILQKTEVDIAELARESVADSGMGARSEVVVSAGDALATVDRDRVKQVFLNLISNAAKFSGDTGSITTTIAPGGDHIVCSVRDQGPGIPKAQMNRLFQRFSRLDTGEERKPGSGLGLYLSRVLVEQHGGEIWVDSVEGKGATFSFRLPRSD